MVFGWHCSSFRAIVLGRLRKELDALLHRFFFVHDEMHCRVGDLARSAEMRGLEAMVSFL